jgi:hypothetical protein
VTDPLTQIAMRHGTDKWGGHFYTPVYHELFKDLRDRPLKMLEIGVGGFSFYNAGGHSLRMWAEYFPNADITGIDIVPKRVPVPDRVRILQGSQDDMAFLAKVGADHGPFDIILDDGSHIPQHVVASFNGLFPHLKEDGLYVIEDVQTTYWSSFGGSVMRGGDTMKLVRELLDGLNHVEIAAVSNLNRSHAYSPKIKAIRAFHNIVVIEKGDNTEPSNARYDLKHPKAMEAIATLKAFLEQEPTAPAYASLISLYAMGGDLASAKALLAKALDLWPDSIDLILSAANLAGATGDRAGHLMWMEKVLAREPDNPECQRVVADTKRALGI